MNERRYPYWREYAENHHRKGEPPVFYASGTYANASLWSGAALQDATTRLALMGSSNIVFLRKVTPGPIIDRHVLASAMVCLDCCAGHCTRGQLHWLLLWLLHWLPVFGRVL